MPQSIIMRRPDDWHVHLRDGEILAQVVDSTAAHFARALIMPNLSIPVTTIAQATEYYDLIKSAVNHSFEPCMSLYLTHRTSAEHIASLDKHPHIHACKLYPKSATTNSEYGIDTLNALGELDDVFSAMASAGILLLIHGESTQSSLDVFDKERDFVENTLPTILNRHPTLRVVLEHISTKFSADFVMSQNGRLAATITPHHLSLTRNDIFFGGINPHYYCLPLLQTADDRNALIVAATSGKPWFFAGTDSAPHLIDAKQSECGCAGIFNAPTALSVYAEVFSQANSLNKLEGFLSIYGAEYYRQELNQDEICLEEKPWVAPETITCPDGGKIKIFKGGCELKWQKRDN